MTAILVVQPFETFNNVDGSPLDAGYIYVGVENLEPIANPLAIYWDEALTIPASQPIRTINGYLSRGGSPGTLFSSARFSILVETKTGSLVYSSLSVGNSFASNLANTSNAALGDALVGVKSAITGAVATTQHEVNSRVVSLSDVDPAIDRTGVVDSSIDFRAMASSGATYIKVPSGTYKVSGDKVINILSNQVWDFDNVILNWTPVGAFDSCVYAVDNGTTNRSVDWAIRGKLTIVGPNAGTPVAGTTNGVQIIGGQRWMVENVTAKNVNGWGIIYDGGGVAVSPRGDQGRFVNCAAYSCWIGGATYNSAANEYTIWVGFQASGNGSIGISDGAGNTQWIGGNCIDNLDVGFKVDSIGGGNSAHGTCTGMNINHNAGDNIYCQNVINGYTFNGCHIYGDSTTTGRIHFTTSQGVSITDGIIDAAVLADGIPGVNTIARNFIPSVTNFNVITGAAAASVYLKDNYLGNGPHINNDVAWAYASARRGGSQSLTTGVMTDVIFNTETSDLRANYDNTTGIFTCPKPGVYRASYTLVIIGAATPTGYSKLVKNSGGDTDVTWAGFSAIDSGTASSQLSVDVICVAGDTLRVRVQATATTPTVVSALSFASFELKEARTS